MSKNYSQRAQTAQKITTKLEMPGFNPDNVTFDEETRSPRFLSSFERGGMRPLKPHQKLLYAQHQEKLKKQSALKQQQKLNNKSIAVTDLSRFGNDKGEVKKCVNLGGNAFTTKDKIAAMNRKNIFEENYYGAPYSIANKRKQEGPRGEEKEQKIKLDDSMTNSTLKLVERVAQEEKVKQEQRVKQQERPEREDKIAFISNEVTIIHQLLREKQQQNTVLKELMQRLLGKLSEKTQPQQQGNFKSSNVQNLMLREELKKAAAALQGMDVQKKKLIKSLNILQSNYDSLLLKSQDMELLVKEQQTITEKITVSLRECEAKLRQSEIRCQHLEGKLVSQKALSTRPKFCSETIIQNELSEFLCSSIEEFAGRRVRRGKLVFQMDDWNTNITKYLDRPPFPLLLFIQSAQGNLFGAFSDGLETVKGSVNSEGKLLRALLFNGNAKTVFPSTGKGNAGSYFQNYLKFGNNQLAIKNHNLGRVNVAVGSIFGEKYFNIPRRSHLTGENSEVVEIVTLEVFEVFFE